MSRACPPGFDEAARAALRARKVAELPRRYSPRLHVALPPLLGLGLAGAAMATSADLRLRDLAFVPAFVAFFNAVEWCVHRGVLHRRQRGLAVFYDRHTPVHHRVFVPWDMAIRSPYELGFVLVPWYGSLALFAFTLPFALALAALGERNLGALFEATAMIYLVIYEALHLACHLPPSSRLGRLRAVAWGRRHHAVHHDPARMQRWNFNVTFPLGDLLGGTLLRRGEHI